MRTPREILTEILNATGVPYRYGGTSYHFNVFCPSNLKPWTEEQRGKIDAALQARGVVEYPAGNFERFGTTQDVCFPVSRRYHESRTQERLRGFRVYLERQSSSESV